MDHGVKLGIAGAAELGIATLLPFPWTLAIAWPGAVTLAVGVATWAQRPTVLGKRADGGFPTWSLLVWGTWHALYRAIGRGLLLGGRVRTEVHPGWWVSGWPRAADWPEPPSVVDVTCELPRVMTGPYHLVPLLDRTAPTPAQLDAASAWAVEARARGPVLVHCAQGRGRSVTVLCACLVRADVHPTWREAFAHVREVHPIARLSAPQIAALDAWEAR